MAFFDYEDYSAEIAEITGRPEFQNAEILVVDNRIAGETNIDTGEREGAAPVKVYQGQARVQTTRAGVDSYNQQQANKVTLEALRIQLPEPAKEVILHRGWKVYFLSIPRNPSLRQRVATITEDSQGSHAATRTFDAHIDGDGVISETALQSLLDYFESEGP